MQDNLKMSKKLRDVVMSTQQVLCTGNPEKNTIASGIKEIWPNTTFIYKSSGYDLYHMPSTTKEKLVTNIKKHNIIVNASYVGYNVQLNFLNFVANELKYGHVFNIGSTHEYDNLGNEEYKESKLNLRNRSLEINNYRLNTTHLMLGSIDLITPLKIAKMIKWITEQDVKFPILCIDQEKKSW